MAVLISCTWHEKPYLPHQVSPFSLFVPTTKFSAMGRASEKEKPVEERSSQPITVSSLLYRLMEAVRVASTCECVFVRAQALKAMFWMLAEGESMEETVATLRGELQVSWRGKFNERPATLIGLLLQDPAWTPPMLNDLLHALHLRFKVKGNSWCGDIALHLGHWLTHSSQVSPSMAVQILDLANVFVTHVPGKLDVAAIQALWKVYDCLSL